MARPKKDYVPMSVRLATPVYDRLNKYCEESGQPKTVAIERALNAFINDYEEEQEMIQQLKQKRSY